MDREEALEALRRSPGGGRKPPPRGHLRWSWVVAAALVLVIVIAAVLWWLLTAPRAVAVETVTVRASAAASAGAALSASGYVVARERATVSSKITGMIRRVLVSEGEHIKQGQLVAVLDDSSEQTAIQRAQAQLAADRARIGQAQAVRTQARLTLKRRQELIKQHLVSEADLDQAIANAKSAEAEFKAAQAQVAVDQAMLDAAELQKKYTRIVAPFDGVVTKVYAQPGEMISPGAVGGFTQTGICDLVNMRSLEVHVDINEDYLTKVKKGMSTRITLSAYPGRHFAGHIIEVVPMVNRAQATVEVHVVFEKLDSYILPGMQAQVFFYPANAMEAKTAGAAAFISIPGQAVQHDKDGDFVYVVVNGRLKRQFVHVRRVANGRDTVISGLSGGEQIVVGSDALLQPGIAVRVKPPEKA